MGILASIVIPDSHLVRRLLHLALDVIALPTSFRTMSSVPQSSERKPAQSPTEGRVGLEVGVGGWDDNFSLL